MPRRRRKASNRLVAHVAKPMATLAASYSHCGKLFRWRAENSVSSCIFRQRCVEEVSDDFRAGYQVYLVYLVSLFETPDKR
jgi:hypothetical protein